MADKKNILLAGLAFIGAYLFLGKKDKNTTPTFTTNNSNNTSSTSNPNLNLNTNASASDSNYLDLLKAKNDLEATDGIYSRGVYISDVTMQVFLMERNTMDWGYISSRTITLSGLNSLIQLMFQCR